LIQPCYFGITSGPDRQFVISPRGMDSHSALQLELAGADKFIIWLSECSCLLRGSRLVEINAVLLAETGWRPGVRPRMTGRDYRNGQQQFGAGYGLLW